MNAIMLRYVTLFVCSGIILSVKDFTVVHLLVYLAGFTLGYIMCITSRIIKEENQNKDDK